MNIKIIDNFLEKEDFEDLCSIELKEIKKNEIYIHHNKIYGEEIIENSCLDAELLTRLNKKYHQKAIYLLEELNQKKVKLYDFSEFHIIQTGSNYKFPIHDDTPDKLLSGVIYLKPKKNSGTIFYKNKKGDGEKEITWKQNRAVFFSRTERSSWHSFRGDGSSDRIALVYNLKTSNLKGVYEAESNNYLIGSLRYKLNPYLLRFFNFTI